LANGDEVPGFGALDSNEWKPGIQKRLDIRSEKTAPNLIDTTSVKYIVDALQGGFSNIETINQGFNPTVLAAATNEFVMLSPEPLQAPNENANNQEFEIRLIGIECDLTGFTSIAGNPFNMDFSLHTPENNSLTRFLRYTFSQNAGQTEYRVSLPGMFDDYDSGGDRQGLTWNGYIPARTTLTVQLALEGGQTFAGTETWDLDYIYIRVPKGTRLPL